MLLKNQREQHHVLKGQGDCWQWNAFGQCSKGDNCSFWHDANKRVKLAAQPAPSPEHPWSQNVKDSVKANSPSGRSPSGRFHRMPCCKFGDKYSFEYRRVEEKLSKRCEKGGDKCAVACSIARNTEFGFRTWSRQRSSSILRKSSTTTKPIRCVRFSTAALRNAKFRDRNPSLD